MANVGELKIQVRLDVEELDRQVQALKSLVEARALSAEPQSPAEYGLDLADDDQPRRVDPAAASPTPRTVAPSHRANRRARLMASASMTFYEQDEPKLSLRPNLGNDSVAPFAVLRLGDSTVLDTTCVHFSSTAAAIAWLEEQLATISSESGVA